MNYNTASCIMIFIYSSNAVFSFLIGFFLEPDLHFMLTLYLSFKAQRSELPIFALHNDLEKPATGNFKTAVSFN